MAKLVSPGFNATTLVNDILAPVEDRIIEFKGLNRKDYVDEGEMSDMRNLTSDKYPYLIPRKPRGELTLPAGVLRPLHIISKFSNIAMIARKTDQSIAFYFNGTEITAVDDITASTRMVAINTKICFFPEKKYIEVVKEGNNVICDGSTYGDLETTVTASSLDISVSNEDARVTIASGSGLGYDDAINVIGTLSYTPSGSSTSASAACNVSCIIEEKIAVNESYDTLVLPRESFIEMTGEGATNISFSGTISRTMPTLDHVIEWNNRLWGACNEDNTVYACKLGDPKNWQYFQGTSLDSYYAQQGTDEEWTGVGVYSNHIIFFKPSSMCRVYGTAPSNFQVTNTQCFGVEDGSRQSVVTINDRVFYKSKIGIMAYDGGIPYCISEKFNEKFYGVVAGTEGKKYYASIHAENANRLMVLDVEKAVWHQEDDTLFRNCCTLSNRLYYVTFDSEMMSCDTDLLCGDYQFLGSEDVSGRIKIANPELETERYEDYSWMAVFGPFDEYIENRKIYSKISLRLNVFEKTTLSVYISIDQGAWEKVQEYTAAETGGHIIPIIPRRCDRYSIKLEGQGYCEVKALTRRVRKGTHGKL